MFLILRRHSSSWPVRLLARVCRCHCWWGSSRTRRCQYCSEPRSLDWARPGRWRGERCWSWTPDLQGCFPPERCWTGEREERKRNTFQRETCSVVVQTTFAIRFCADVCLLAGVWAGFGLMEAAAQGWMEERNLRGQEIVAGNRGQQYNGQSDENDHTSGILEEGEQQCGVMDKDQFKYQKFICWWRFLAECLICVCNIQTELSWCAPVSSSAFHPASSIKKIKMNRM